MNTRTTNARKARRALRKLARKLHRLGDHKLGVKWHNIARRVTTRQCKATQS